MSSAEVLLFDVGADPSEETDLSLLYPAIVEQMGALIDAAVATKVAEGPPVDETCPAASFEQDPVVGDCWRSWCSVGGGAASVEV